MRNSLEQFGAIGSCICVVICFALLGHYGNVPQHEFTRVVPFPSQLLIIVSMFGAIGSVLLFALGRAKRK